MKKLLGILLALVLMTGLAACGTEETPATASSPKTTVAATEKKDETTEVVEETTEAAPVTAEDLRPEGYPKKNISMIVPANAGSLVDLLSRDVANMIDLGSEILITNRGGAGMTVGAAEAAMTKGDGYNMSIIGDTGLVVKPVQLGLTYSYEDFRYVGITTARATIMLVATPDSGYTTWDQVVEASKAGEEITFTTGNAGSMQHLGLLQLMKESGVDLKFVPYNGSGEVNAALAGSHVDLGILIQNPNMQKAREGQITPLMMFTDERNEEFPDVPVADEYNVHGMSYASLVVMVMPKDTPDDIFKFVKAKADVLFASEEYAAARAKMGASAPPIVTEEELMSMIKAEHELVTRLSKEAGLIK